MSDSNTQKYRQLALFTTIVAEVVVTPSAMGGLVYYITQGKSFQTVASGVAALAGLGIAVYRIFLLNRRLTAEAKADDGPSASP